jgi:hypothetical protein
LWRIILCALTYFAVVFGVGFLLGPIRVFLLEPTLGKTAAVLCEMPVLLTAMVAVARWIPARLHVQTGVWPLVFIGLAALALLEAADFFVGALLRGMTAGDQLAYLATPAGAIYLAAQGLFALMPLLANYNRARG